MLGENMSGKVFVDMFSCSGQIGFEALSRGAERVFFFEKDRKRFGFIKKQLEELSSAGKAAVYNGDSVEMLSNLKESGIVPDIVFVDPPYVKGGVDGDDLYVKALTAVSQVVSERCNVLVQHFHEHELPDRISCLERIKLKKYGTTLLSLYRLTSP